MKTIGRNPLLSALSLLLVLAMSVTMLSVSVFAAVPAGVSASMEDNGDFGEAEDGTDTTVTKVLTVSNVSTAAVTVWAEVSGDDETDFVVDIATSGVSVSGSASETINVSTKSNLTEKSYTTTLTVYEDDAHGAVIDTFTLDFEVTAAGGGPNPATPSVTSVTVSPKTATLYDNDRTVQLSADVVVENGAAQTVTWTSQDTSVVTVNSSSGLVTVAATSGTTTVTATSTVDNSKTDTCSVTVDLNNNATTYKVTYDANGGTGSVPSDANNYLKNAQVTVLFTPEPTKADYTFLGWDTDKTKTTPTYAANGTKFTITADTTLYAIWEADAPIATGGTTHSVSITNNTQKKNGVTATVTVTPGGKQLENVPMTATVKLTGIATEAGEFYTNLWVNQGAMILTPPEELLFKIIEAGDVLTDTYDFTFTMPDTDVELELTFHFYSDLPELAVTSTGIKGGYIDDAYGMHGTQYVMSNGTRVPTRSLPLAIGNVPAGTKSFAIYMMDITPDEGVGFVHWMAVIPANLANLSANASIANAAQMVQGKNDFGTVGYGGPTPPSKNHEYLIEVRAFDVDVANFGLTNGFDDGQFWSALGNNGWGTGYGEIVGIYRLNKTVVNNNTTTSSSSSGGSSGGSSVPPNVARSANVSADGSVNSTSAANDLKKAMASATGNDAVVTVKNAESISAATIKSLAKTAKDAGKNAVIRADTLAADGSIQGRLYVEPSKLAGLNQDLKLGVSTEGARPAARQAFFEKNFDNKVAVISCAQQGSFGAPLKIAAKVKLPGDGESLNFYSYDAKTNTYTKIETSYRIDKNGYIHFETELAGDIIISDKPLKKK